MDFEYREPVEGFDQDYILGDTVPFLSVGATLAIANLYVDIYQQFTAEGESDSDSFGRSKFDREERLVTVGYTMSKNGSIFAGLRTTSFDSKTDFFFDQFSTKAEYDGPFIGANRLWAFTGFGGGKKVFSAKVSLNYLEIDIVRTLASNPSLPFRESGDAFGLNLGVSLAGIFENDVQYSFAIDTYDFSFDLDSGTEATENAIRFSANFSKPLVF